MESSQAQCGRAVRIVTLSTCALLGISYSPSYLAYAFRKRFRIGSSVVRFVISGPGVHVKQRQTRRGGNFDLDASPGPIMTRAIRLVSQDVLVAKFHANLRGNARQFVQIRNR